MFMVSSMKWVMVVFPAAIFAIIFVPMIAPNALSAAPQWVIPVVAMVAPLALGLISASWLWWRGGTVSAVVGPPSGGKMWLSSLVLTRWLYLIILPVFIIVIVLLVKFAPGVLSTIPLRVIPAFALGVAVLLLALRSADVIPPVAVTLFFEA